MNEFYSRCLRLNTFLLPDYWDYPDLASATVISFVQIWANEVVTRPVRVLNDELCRHFLSFLEIMPKFALPQ